MQESPGISYIHANVQPQNMNNVNWKAAPLHFKLYRNCEQISCAYETMGEPTALAEDGLRRMQIGQMLSDIYGFTRQCHTITEDSPIYQSPFLQLLHSEETHDTGFYTSLLRPVPSGGALFPCELYLLVGPEKSFPAGIYHYDAAHHALVILRQGDYIHLLQTYLAHPGDAPPAYTLLLSCCFWKDGFKYGAFSYRLQGLDIGTVIAQSEIITNHYDLEATIHYQFLDKPIDDLVGLDPLHESIYAVMTLSTAQQPSLNSGEAQSASRQEEPDLAQPVPTAERLESITHWPLPEAVHRASLIETRAAFCALHRLPPIKPPESIANQALSASDVSLDLWEGRHKRHSAPGSFLPVPLTEQQLAQLLLASTRGSVNDIAGRSDFRRHALLYCIINHVENIPAGIYCYHPERHVLEVVCTGKVQRKFQELQKWPSLNLFHMSVCLLPVANYKDGFQIYGDRWYRIQNMEAGIIVQRLYLAAAVLNLGCRASLGYHAPEMDTFLCLPDGYMSLVQMLIAPQGPAYRYYAQSLLI